MREQATVVAKKIRSEYPTIYGDDEGEGRGELSFGTGTISADSSSSNDSGMPSIYRSFEGTDPESLTEDEIYDALNDLVGRNVSNSIIEIGINAVDDFNSKLSQAYGREVTVLDKTPLLDMTPVGIVAFLYVYQLGVWSKTLNFVQLPGTAYHASSAVFNANS